MESSDKTARELYQDVKNNPARKRFGFGNKAVLVNIDLQKAYTRTDLFATAYETDPGQLDYVNQLATRFRALDWPVVWTHVAYMDSAEDAGIWGTRTNTPDSLQNIKEPSERAELDPRLKIDRNRDAVINKRMASVFHDTLIPSLLVWHKVDTVILTGGSTSGCIRASAVASLSTGYRTIVPEECVSDKHEIPHFANLCDIMLKYADVEPVSAVKTWLENHPGCKPIRQARGCGF
jgi:nicotinamidase-related amidase